MWSSSDIFELVINEVELMARIDRLCNLTHLSAIPSDDVLFNNTVDMLLRGNRIKEWYDPVVKYGPISCEE